MRTAENGPIYPEAGVTAASPATTPLATPSTEGFPRCIHSTTIHTNAPVAAAAWVARKAVPATPFAPNALPALNPNQPNQSRPVPNNVKGRLCGGM